MKCLKKEDLAIWGDYNSASTQQIAIKFKMCQDHDYCESEENIRKWLRRKFIVVVTNEVLWNQEVYFADTELA